MLQRCVFVTQKEIETEYEKQFQAYMQGMQALDGNAFPSGVNQLLLLDPGCGWCAVMGHKKVRAASPLRRSRFLVCLAPSPTYLGRVFWCAFKLLAPRWAKKCNPGALLHT
jgi:hypothetical protein